MDTVLTVILVLVVAILISTVFVMIGWSLFMVPVFGMKSLTFMQALGFGFLAAAFKSSYTSK